MHGTLNGEAGEMAIQDLQETAFVGPAAAWYALLVESNSERKACIWLRRRQYEPYWPRYKGQVKLNRHRRAERWRSVIPGYLFLPVGERGANWKLIEDAPGFRAFLRSGTGELVQIPEFGKQGIERIRQIAEALNASPIAAADGVPYKVGQLVRLSRLEIQGKVIRIDRKRRIEVETTMFGRITKISLPASEIEPL